VKADLLNANLSEAKFQVQVIQLAEMLDWNWYHTKDSRKSNEGFPDLCFWRERVLWMELKKESGVCTPCQLRCHSELIEAGAEVYVFKPSQFALIQAVLEKRRKPE
jgi:hypothetical protein